jgi:glycine cleavage system protein P-like pyridoxal-binding family
MWPHPEPLLFEKSSPARLLKRWPLALDAFAKAMINIAAEAVQDTALLLGAPRTTPVSRLDQVAAARRPQLRFKKQKGEPE